ncbi:phytoene desaturase family protein, partial [Staphylococcus hominis]
GISAAIRMAQSGYEVSLFEQNEHIGGKVNRLETKGFGFDLGPSILTMPQIFERLFEYSNKHMKDYVTIERLPLQWRSFFT